MSLPINTMKITRLALLALFNTGLTLPTAAQQPDPAVPATAIAATQNPAAVPAPGPAPAAPSTPAITQPANDKPWHQSHKHHHHKKHHKNAAAKQEHQREQNAAAVPAATPQPQ